MNRTFSMVAALALFLFLLFILFDLPWTRRQPDVVIVLIDTLRADHTSLYGYGRDTTPHLRQLAKKGVVLTRHFANAPWTKPSVASIVTGLHPSAHGSRKGQFEQVGQESVEVLSRRIPTLAEILGEAGYVTFAHVSNMHLAPSFGYDQGYQEYHFVPDDSVFSRVVDSDRRAIEATLRFLDQEKAPVFAWVHLMSVHQYRFPQSFAVFEKDSRTPIDRAAPQARRVVDYDSLEAVVDDYDNSILYADSLVGELAAAIFADSSSPALLVVTSDHGEELYDHGDYEHVHTLYNELLRVPTILVGSSVPRGQVSGITDSVDLLPTILDRLGFASPAYGLAGQALLAEGRVGRGKAESFAEQHHRGPRRRFSLVTEGGKLIVSENKSDGQPLYEHYLDPFAIENSDGGAKGKTPPAMLSRLNFYRDETRRFAARWGEIENKPLNLDEIEKLRSLGYL